MITIISVQREIVGVPYGGYPNVLWFLICTSVIRREKNQQASESPREKCNAQTLLRENLPPSPVLRGRRGIGENETEIFPNATLLGWILARLCVFRTLNVNAFS